MVTATTARHPEIVAIEVIFEALRRLPDRGTRESVMNYARHLIETEEEEAIDQPPLRANGEASDATP